MEHIHSGEKTKVIILAAGKGTRFRSEKPKVLHEILGKPMIFYVSLSARWINPEQIIYVVGHKKEEVKKAINCDRCVYVEQDQQLGTGHAVAAAKDYFKDYDGYVLIMNGDMPLIKGETLKNAISFMDALVRYEGANLGDMAGYRNENIAGVVLTAYMQDPTGYGRVIKDSQHRVLRIVEEKDASPQERSIKEVNTGIYIFYAPYLAEVIDQLENDNAQNEYYITDVIRLLRKKGKEVHSLIIPDPTEAIGINNRWDLARAENIMKMQYLSFWALNGATIHSPETVWIEFDVDLSKDVEIFPNVMLRGSTQIGEGTVIESNCIIKNSRIGKNVKILANTVIEDSVIQDNAVVGPFSRIRNNTVVGSEAVIGNFVEVKNSKIGDRTNVRHLSYIGDAEVGNDVNIGAGTITCNYDGFKKHKTVIKDKAFIGSDTMLVAPVTVGEEAITGSGSVITKDVPDKALAVERSAQKIIPNYAEIRKKKKGADE
ncbi:MAG TPA: UDP-N-acetylglucosamine diphosphorylase/glucosamine-1-phosphate N-acetyltransferase [Persephonella sp.]|uniref:Bifunctional protein GlmU n=1 Tax=Persephonella marina (strain DSM 14350 / EX-H1) TaxID=123214 RepID=C0QR66_PERMH|nr:MULTISPECIES: bifunctional UDP-N-acetylglucosamine diphosphorylase/glucosamine-1-phosphate N-acetyltransferase GlmU [Persephonella]ACO03412.1 UDP-N-acetylglucosamine diphosphorylase/glucosamine-1-phosphate N-acetyltransferase [Persephonella marina EX-H1]HCB68909.1 UDP-N-acetylglucosamine diphosphorylase/glucosamine-1-phosphate N-acetyltransferase [Persephonella sp.]